MLRISALRVNRSSNISAQLKPCFLNTCSYQPLKSQPFRPYKTQSGLNSNLKIPQHFQDKISRRLDTSPSNPIGIIAQHIKDFFNSYQDVVISSRKFDFFTVESNPVSISQNFDELQVPLDHVSRDPSDTYYLDHEYIEKYKEYKSKAYLDIINSEKNGVYGRDLIESMASSFGHSRYRLLPTHTTSHITGFLKRGIPQALYSGQVFRRDEIDAQHYPVFHQMDGYLLFSREDVEALRKLEEYKGFGDSEVILRHLKRTLESLVSYMYGFVKFVAKTPSEHYEKVLFSALEKQWDDKATFPFTYPSSEYYISNDGEMTELLGCGVLKNIILENNLPKRGKYVGGWAFGIGLERMAMVLCKIFDIRQFWETDERFTRQYESSYADGILPIFSKYSKNPPVTRDISFYLSDAFDEERFKNAILENGKGYVEGVEFISSYFNDKLQRKSLCYRVTYRGFNENLTNSFVNELHDLAIDSVKHRFNLIIR
ncbi:phenylalanyl-tRNA synthetase [Theileria orientalis strain Shintoku]|uniref:phenylalanine--tRNA ligase n=1 Tax=Theileria orientalis strain Shintoku TaxID=869250 RepID=J4C7Z2_THEOR|nr:phenylalanyl-tRNA synthetase [Theileria orientalis strain Shintoku]PVC53926.1 phenylalanyl-tRNA synthetase [Theileria orientalis]BAM39883.1 phenylalanyl-tRNA synthetase [Theileria orientalis strain Shintoku]|eukprot:XP_009690184.1 phenylalanyl-tRNA synthetase [Theileria orientalis strain Shintoku]